MYPIPGNWYQVPCITCLVYSGARCSVPRTWYRVPGTAYLGPSTWYQVAGTWHPVQCSRYQVPCTRHLVPGARYQVVRRSRSRYLAPGTLNQVLCIDYLRSEHLFGESSHLFRVCDTYPCSGNGVRSQTSVFRRRIRFSLQVLHGYAGHARVVSRIST